MTTVVKPDSDALQDLFWQDELTEAMSWLSEGCESEPIDVATLQRVLWPGATLDAARLQKLVAEGLVTLERVQDAAAAQRLQHAGLQVLRRRRGGHRVVDPVQRLVPFAVST